MKSLMGFPESGARLVNASVAYARHQNNAHSLTWTLGNAADVSHKRHEPATTVRFASEAIGLACEHRMPQWLALGERYRDWATHALGDFDGGLNLLLRGVRRWRETGAALHTTNCEICLVDSYLLQGETAAAGSHLDATRAHCRSYGEKYPAAEMDRLEALLLRCEEAPIEMVEERLVAALQTARQAGARLFELRSTMVLARVLAEHHERHKAIEILAPIWFVASIAGLQAVAPIARGLCEIVHMEHFKSHGQTSHSQFGSCDGDLEAGGRCRLTRSKCDGPLPSLHRHYTCFLAERPKTWPYGAPELLATADEVIE